MEFRKMMSGILWQPIARTLLERLAQTPFEKIDDLPRK
jgi:hypothetical protein